VRRLICLLPLAALAACGRGESGGGASAGISVESSESRSTSLSADRVDTAKQGRSQERTASITLPVDRTLNLALGASPAIRAKALKEVAAGRNPLEASAPAGEALSIAASLVASSVDFWEVTPTSLVSGRADGHGSRAERAYVEAHDAAACLTNEVGSLLAPEVARPTSVWTTPAAAVDAAKDLIARIPVQQIDEARRACVKFAAELPRVLGQDTPSWSAGTYSLATGKGGVQVAQNGVEKWFGGGAYSGVIYELKVAKATSLGFESTAGNKTDTSTDARQSTNTTVGVGK